jgi:hypothetical protein
MMLNIQAFIPRYFQFKLHIDAQMGSGVPASREPFLDKEISSGSPAPIF